MQIIGVYAAEVADAAVRFDPSEHSEYAWLPYATCLDRVHYRGLKDGHHRQTKLAALAGSPPR